MKNQIKEWTERWNNGDTKFVPELLDLVEELEKQACEMAEKHADKDIFIEELHDMLKPLDEINHPVHYHKGGIDVIGFAEKHYSKEELKGFFRINAIKYLDRYDKKGGTKDLHKCVFYVNKLIELEGEPT